MTPHTFIRPVFILLAFAIITIANASDKFIPCHSEPERQALRSLELQKIVTEDQTDREPPIDWEKVQQRDESRRKRVGEIFGEGCFKAAEDYAAAALVYQHGNTPDHYFQTFLWTKKAVELGMTSQKRLMALGVDRYLVKSGYKQLFATQASQPSINDCWCLEELEGHFPENRRLELSGQTMDEVWQWIESLNQEQRGCKSIKFCTNNLKETPKGTIPGFW